MLFYIYINHSLNFDEKFFNSENEKNKLDTHPELLTSLRWLSDDSKIYNAFAKDLIKIGLFKKEEEFNSRSLKPKPPSYTSYAVIQFLFTMFTFVPAYSFFY